MIIAKDPSIESVVRITTAVDEPRVAFFSGIHGNEVSGFMPSKSFCSILRRHAVPEARHSHLGAGIRKGFWLVSSFTSRLNMNRLFREEYDASLDRTCYEFVRTQQLKTLLVPSLGSGKSLPDGANFLQARSAVTPKILPVLMRVLAATVEAGSHFDRSAFGASEP